MIGPRMSRQSRLGVTAADANGSNPTEALREVTSARRSRTAQTLPRILVISNNPFSATSNNGKTLASFFVDYPRERLAQIYFSDAPPSRNTCSRYLKVSDADIARRITRIDAARGSRSSKELAPSDANASGALKPRRRSHGSLARLARELMWASRAWRTRELDALLKEYAPEVIFFMAGDSAFAYDICQYVKQRTRANVCVYVTDDYILPRRTISPFWWIRRAIVESKLRAVLHGATLFFTISEQMREAYHSRLGVDSYVAVHQPRRISPAPFAPAASGKDAVRLVYAGGLHYRRHQVLAELAREISRYNDTSPSHRRAQLEVYSTDSPSDQVRRTLDVPGASQFMGALDAAGVDRALAAADVCVHVESFDSRSRESTRLSVSTKLPEYLSIGKPILAIGPAEVASMRYLVGAALCVTDFSKLRENLERLLSSEAVRAAYSASALKRAGEMESTAQSSGGVIDRIIQALSAPGLDCGEGCPNAGRT